MKSVHLFLVSLVFCLSLSCRSPEIVINAPSKVKIGSSFLYTVMLTNLMASDSGIFNNTLPPELIFQSISFGSSITLNNLIVPKNGEPGGTISASLVPTKTCNQDSIIMELILNPKCQTGKLVTNSLTVLGHSSKSELVATDNLVLNITTTCPKKQIRPGQPIQFTITVTNMTRTTRAQEIRIVNKVDPALTSLQAVGKPWQLALKGHILRAHLKTLAPGASASFTLYGIVNKKAQPATLINYAQITSTQPYNFNPQKTSTITLSII